MKLFEISNRVNIAVLKEIAKALDKTTSTEWEGNDGLKGFKILEKYFTHPDVKPFMFRGKMFRAFMSEGADNPLDEKEILQYTGNRTLYSFSKSEGGVENWLEQLGDIESSETITIIEQIGVGYDVQKIFRYVNKFNEEEIQQAADSERSKRNLLYHLNRAGGTSSSHRTGAVHEIVGPVNKSLKVIDIRSTDLSDEYDDDDDDDE